jgi:site-specific DNA recombinase
VVCSNSLKVSRKLVESVLLEAIPKDLFTEEGLAVFKEEVTRLLAEHRRTRRPDQAQAKKRLQDLEQEIANIMQAIKAGILTASTKAALEEAEAERAHLLQSVEGHDKRLEKVATFLPNLSERFKALVDDLETVA